MNRAAKIDRSWRTGKPCGLNAEEFDAGQRAVYCARLLRFDSTRLWPCGHPDLPGDDEHSAFAYGWLDGYLCLLESTAPAPDPADPELMGYLRTLAHCRDVMDGRAKPEVAGPTGFQNLGGYRRGIYLPKGGATA